MAESTFLWISESEVVSLIDMQQAMAALEKGLLAEARGEATNMVKTHVQWGDHHTLHALGAVFPKTGFVGTKTWSHTRGGAIPLLILYDSNNGALKAIIEAFALGQMRTAGASGVCTQWLSAADAEEFAIIGTGKQALPQVAAVLAVRSIRRIRVFSPNAEHRNQFAARLREAFDVDVVATGSVREAVQHAAIITLATRATEPFLSADMLETGAHINAVGAIVPSRAEISSDVIARCTRIVADSVAQAQSLSRELREFFGTDSAKWASVESLANVVAGRTERTPFDDVTLFKSLGMGISDLSLGIEIYQRAVERGRGSRFPHPQKVAWRFAKTESEKNRAGA